MEEEYHIYVFTNDRIGKQLTLSNLHRTWLDRTTLVVRKEEYKKHEHDRYLVLPGKERLGPARQYVLDTTPYKWITMLDDDLQWAKRVNGSLPCAKQWQHPFSLGLFLQQENWLREGVVHCGVSAREGNNRCKEEYKEVDRMMRVLSYNVEVLRKEGVRFDRLELKADFDMTLQLLLLGYPNRVSYLFAQGQDASHMPGGCAEYRTQELNDRVCEQLEELYPDFVNVNLKFTNNWGEEFGNVRNDVSIKWKKAYEEGVRRRKDV